MKTKTVLLVLRPEYIATYARAINSMDRDKFPISNFVSLRNDQLEEKTPPPSWMMAELGYRVARILIENKY